LFSAFDVHEHRCLVCACLGFVERHATRRAGLFRYLGSIAASPENQHQHACRVNYAGNYAATTKSSSELAVA
jgi:hypothetical protein